MQTIQNNNQIPSQIHQLSLSQIFQRQQLQLQQILLVKDIQFKVKKQMKAFVNYCLIKHQFTDRLITLGLQCPMHQSNNIKTKSLTSTALDILTSDHDYIADIFIVPQNQNQDTDSEIKQQIIEETQNQQVDRFKYLHKILDFLSQESPDQNCLNYIGKTLNTIIRVKPYQFLQFLGQYPEHLARLTQLTHFPGIAHVVSKIVIDEDQKVIGIAKQVRKQILPMILQKIHSQIDRIETKQVLQCIQQVLRASRYNDMIQQNKQTTIFADILVCKQQIQFFIMQIWRALQSEQKSILNKNRLSNAIAYLFLILDRIRQDIKLDFNGQTSIQYSLKYQTDQLFNNFSKFLSKIHIFTSFDNYILLIVQYLQLLIQITKNPQFGQKYYITNQKQHRKQAVLNLIVIICEHKVKGISLQYCIHLLQKIIMYEIQYINKQNIISPIQLFDKLSIQIYKIEKQVKQMLRQNLKQRNKNQNGVYYRKMCLVLDQYLTSQKIIQVFPINKTITHFFQLFQQQNSKYLPNTVVKNHPGGKKAQQVKQFGFLLRNQLTYSKLLAKKSSSQQNSNISQQLLLEQQPQNIEIKQIKQKPQIQLKKINQKIMVLKQKRSMSKDNIDTQGNKKQQIQKNQSNKNEQQLFKIENQKQQNINVISPTKNTQLQSGVTFFTRHIMLY